MLPVLLIFVVILFALSIWLFLMYRQAKDIRLVETDLYLKDWPAGFEGIRILFVSDLHREVVPEKIKAELKKKTIDLVLFGGDLVVKDDSFDRVLEEIRFMASLAPSYFVWGNHDYEADYRHFDQLLRSNGIGVLDNRAVLFEVGEDNVWLIGVDDATKGRDDLEFALGDIDQPASAFYFATIRPSLSVWRSNTKSDSFSAGTRMADKLSCLGLVRSPGSILFLRHTVQASISC